MKGTALGFVAAALLTSASVAAHDHKLAHEVFHKKRDTVTVVEEGCQVVWSTWYGEPILVPDAPSSTTLTTSVSTTSTPPPQPPSPAPAPPSPPPPAVSQSPSPQPATSSSNSGSFVGQKNALSKAVSSNGAMGITYTPYAGTGYGDTSCKSSDEINSDIQAIRAAGFNTVRIYATDCGQLEAVHQATQSLGMSMIIGVFLNSAGSAQSDFTDQMSNITSYFQSQGGYTGIDLVTIGNEVISSGTASADELSGFLSSARNDLAGSGYQGPVSTALIVADWQSNPGLCSDVDVLASNIHPFFSDNTVQPSDSGGYVDSQIELIEQACGNDGKPVVVTEAGWPSQGPPNNGMEPSQSNQQASINSLRDSQSAKAIMFFANDNDLWKANPGVEEYELYFGCLGQFGQ